MGRINVYLPDELLARLNLERDRINVSRVCAQALERELEWVTSAEAGAERNLVTPNELQSPEFRWRDRGRRDAREWAALAGRTLREIADATRVVDRGGADAESGQWPRTFPYRKKIEHWLAIDAGVRPDSPIRTVRQRDRYDQARRDLNSAAYRDGWMASLRDIAINLGISLPVNRATPEGNVVPSRSRPPSDRHRVDPRAFRRKSQQ